VPAGSGSNSRAPLRNVNRCNKSGSFKSSMWPAKEHERFILLPVLILSRPPALVKAAAPAADAAAETGPPAALRQCDCCDRHRASRGRCRDRRRDRRDQGQ
jgi:hypothetical protein